MPEAIIAPGECALGALHKTNTQVEQLYMLGQINFYAKFYVKKQI